MFNPDDATHLQFLKDELALVKNSGQGRENVIGYLEYRIAYLEQIVNGATESCLL